MDDKVRAQYAHQILENPVFKSAIEVIRAETVKAWAECPARDVEGREQLWKIYRVNEKFLNIFKGYIEAGKLAALNEMHKEQSAPQPATPWDNVTKFFNYKR